jgi:hypothetical protein
VNGTLLGHKSKLDKKNHKTSSETSPQIPLHRPVEPSRLQRRGTDFQDLEIGVELPAFF